MFFFCVLYLSRSQKVHFNAGKRAGRSMVINSSSETVTAHHENNVAALYGGECICLCVCH